MGDVLASFEFDATVIEWRGPAPFLFAPVPEEYYGEIRCAARQASYGWGVVPVEAKIDGVTFSTSLFPRGDTYLLPIKVAVQRATGAALNQRVRIKLSVVAL